MSSKYRDLRTLFHISENDARLVYEQRFNSKDAVRLNFQISGNQAFYVMGLRDLRANYQGDGA